ncbi:MAG: hypothetical protein MRK01_02185 [Candidatus Scalindua sp.]|nr:hypothetical protein [Candidatus Scalindua sp.]
MMKPSAFIGQTFCTYQSFAWESWMYTKRKKSSYQIIAPLPGQYKARMFSGGSTEKDLLARSTIVSVKEDR